MFCFGVTCNTEGSQGQGLSETPAACGRKDTTLCTIYFLVVVDVQLPFSCRVSSSFSSSSSSENVADNGFFFFFFFLVDEYHRMFFENYYFLFLQI